MRYGLDLELHAVIRRDGGLFSPKRHGLHGLGALARKRSEPIRLGTPGLTLPEALSILDPGVLVECTPTDLETGEPGLGYMRTRPPRRLAHRRREQRRPRPPLSGTVRAGRLTKRPDQVQRSDGGRPAHARYGDLCAGGSRDHGHRRHPDRDDEPHPRPDGGGTLVRGRPPRGPGQRHRRARSLAGHRRLGHGLCKILLIANAAAGTAFQLADIPGRGSGT